ncbi:hypothetical protein GCM10009700_21100 [Brevibacterium sanguinis]
MDSFAMVEEVRNSAMERAHYRQFSQSGFFTQLTRGSVVERLIMLYATAHREPESHDVVTI